MSTRTVIWRPNIAGNRCAWLPADMGAFARSFEGKPLMYGKREVGRLRHALAEGDEVTAEIELSDYGRELMGGAVHNSVLGKMSRPLVAQRIAIQNVDLTPLPDWWKPQPESDPEPDVVV